MPMKSKTPRCPTTQKAASTAYNAYGCRCDVCSEWRREYTNTNARKKYMDRYRARPKFKQQQQQYAESYKKSTAYKTMQEKQKEKREKMKADPELKMALRLQDRKNHLKHKYGITLDDFYGMVDDQKNRCAICQTIPKTKLVIDHDHKTSKIRGLLCTECNARLHHDFKTWSKLAINYLRKFDC